MSSPSEPSGTRVVTPALLRDWPLPATEASKYGRGQVLVVGGARGTPGAAMLAAVASLRAGAGRLSLAVAESVAVPVAVAIPESGVVGLPETSSGSVRGDGAERLADSVASSDAVLVGPGLDDAEETAALLRGLAPHVGDDTAVVLDAYALGVLPGLDEVVERLAGRLVLTPNTGEAARLLGREIDDDDLADAVAEIAARYGAVVSCYGEVADPTGGRWQMSTGYAGLATSGSGDVLAGVLCGLLARGADRAQATCWGTHLHAAAGDRLAARIGPTGFLARELLDELPVVLSELVA
ncbi:NAD(P)H-hydrate dehydratase [Cellulomonas aerilata]|uniref:ADP-dependent (S)-NAD(P)H-hydrate dehydratase n=1 Tax=Cellulomonas aerilata TaxID=515326 RepID=A0A512DEK2_9CELL|nr:NAD(P)H-hydrate dehydratase [Cellulomonas aerilata]GEO34914.1 ADP-dependent (S)-NAD(P)H-hydrate dehydratase [Cellulomonas aerilata]